MKKNSKIYVAGHTGLVGSALMRRLAHDGYTHIIVRTIDQLDLREQATVNDFFAQEQPEYVFLAAARVGGIFANNTYKADFMYDNLMIATNVIHAAYKHNVKKLLNLGSSCIYPKNASQPLEESSLLTGTLESTNEPYAIAKIAAIKLCSAYNQQYKTNFISAMPTNLYGPNDNFNSETGHVIPALICKIHEAKTKNITSVSVWGTGKPLREFLYVDDLVTAIMLLMQNIDAHEIGECINIGTGTEISIKQLANSIKKIIGFSGSLIFDESKPDGIQRKLLDSKKIKELGWTNNIQLLEGIFRTYSWYCSHV